MTRLPIIVATGMTVAAAFALAVLGCVSTQDLGSHAAPIATGSSGTPGSSGSSGTPPDTPIVGTSGRKIFFVTDGRYTGNLATEGSATTGLLGGDGVCMAEARAAGLGGTFKAWLSTSRESAKDRIAPVGPWWMVDGTIVFRNASVDEPTAFPTISAKGNDLFFDDNAEVWTGTSAAFNANNDTCAGWTSVLASDRGGRGACTWTNSSWTEEKALGGASEANPCSDRLHLYCFEQ